MNNNIVFMYFDASVQRLKNLDLVEHILIKFKVNHLVNKPQHSGCKL